MQAFTVLVAMEALLLSLRSLYFCMAWEHLGALLRMVLIVIRVSLSFLLAIAEYDHCSSIVYYGRQRCPMQAAFLLFMSMHGHML